MPARGNWPAALGLEVSFGEHLGVCDDFSSAPVQDRLADLHPQLIITRH